VQKQVEGLIFSATDLVNHLECVHLGSLDLLNLADPEPRTGTDEYVQLLQARGFGHEQAYLRALQRAGRKIVEIRPNGQTLQQANEATREAMRAEAEVIYQATLCRENFAGHADFLCRVPRPSKLGDYSYEVIDTKLARSPRAKFLIQLCFYTGLLAEAQGAWPYLMHLVLGDGTERNYRVQDFLHYYQVIQRSFAARMRGDAPPPTYPQPCAHCELCHWQEHCEARWHEDDHLCQVANITRVQIRKLQEQGIYTLAQLANLTEDFALGSLFDVPGPVHLSSATDGLLT
jgi:uncharacterized protein